MTGVIWREEGMMVYLCVTIRNEVVKGSNGKRKYHLQHLSIINTQVRRREEKLLTGRNSGV